MGLSTAPWFFSLFTALLKREAVRRGAGVVEVYLDDFWGKAGPPAAAAAGQKILRQTLADAGTPVHPAKSVLPTQELVFLGVIVDSCKMQLSLGQDKCQALQQKLLRVQQRKRVVKREVESLVGSLNWAAEVVRGGHTFMRGLIHAMNKVRRQDHFVTINAACREDMDWWREALSMFNGVPVIPLVKPRKVPISHNTSDACTTGVGGFFNGEHWTKVLDTPVTSGEMNLTELQAAVEQVERFGSRWKGHEVELGVDNTQAVGWINKGRARPIQAMPLLKKLFWLGIHGQFDLKVIYLPGVHNELADCASRRKWQELEGHLAKWRQQHRLLWI